MKECKTKTTINQFTHTYSTLWRQRLNIIYLYHIFLPSHEHKSTPLFQLKTKFPRNVSYHLSCSNSRNSHCGFQLHVLLSPTLNSTSRLYDGQCLHSTRSLRPNPDCYHSKFTELDHYLRQKTCPSCQMLNLTSLQKNRVHDLSPTPCTIEFLTANKTRFCCGCLLFHFIYYLQILTSPIPY